MAEIGADGDGRRAPVAEAGDPAAVPLSAMETDRARARSSTPTRSRSSTDYAAAGVRVVPGASARCGSFLDRGVVMMPSYVNIGARVGANTMVDTWATVGLVRADRRQRAPLRRGRHRRRARAAAGRAGHRRGRRASSAAAAWSRTGPRVGRGAVLGAGLILTGTIPVIDAETGEELGRGRSRRGRVAVHGHAGRDRSRAASSACRACW